MMRIKEIYRPVSARLQDYKEVERNLTASELNSQAKRCQDCGIPFCHGRGCPLENVIPEINAAVAADNWKLAWDILSSTSDFPEFTSRVCPALCEASCTQGINSDPVMIRQLEKAVVETAFEQGYAQPLMPRGNSGFKVAVVGSGPAGLAVAQRLNRMGHKVAVFEKNAEPGGLLRYGIPDFKLEKNIIQRRVDLMKRAGIHFECNTEVGKDMTLEYLRKRYDALVIAVGTPQPRDLKIPGRELPHVHFALDFLCGQNRLVSGEIGELPISAKGKKVVVIGGGDTGSDCVGTSLRQGAKAVVQLEIMPQPPESRSESTPWPEWPYLLRTSSSHKEGVSRLWCIGSKKFTETGVDYVKVEWEFAPNGKPVKFKEIPGSEGHIEADLVLLALGFVNTPSPEVSGEDVFVCGDAATGQSLVVRAITDARRISEKVNDYLMSRSNEK